MACRGRPYGRPLVAILQRQRSVRPNVTPLYRRNRSGPNLPMSLLHRASVRIPQFSPACTLTPPPAFTEKAVLFRATTFPSISTSGVPYWSRPTPPATYGRDGSHSRKVEEKAQVGAQPGYFCPAIAGFELDAEMCRQRPADGRTHAGARAEEHEGRDLDSGGRLRWLGAILRTRGSRG